MRLANIIVVAASICLASSAVAGQERGPTVAEARVAFVAPSTPTDALTDTLSDALEPPAACGSAVKNAALLGLGFVFAAAVLELTYTFVREPFVLNGVDLPAADPRLIMGAGAAGVIGGLIGTEVCRRRRR